MAVSVEQATNCIRCLAIDTVQKANSGHPGAPMGMAPVSNVLFTEVMNYDPTDPHWHDRDRFVLSNGHASALIYTMLHLTGYALPLEQLQQFRQLGSITPGHPERHLTPGVEVTTGPLGQGISNAVGLAIAEAHLAAKFNKPDVKIVDHFTYVFCGDGCLMEGVAQEALSLVGHLGLEKFIVIYDDNNISIDGNTNLAFTEHSAEKYQALGFHTIVVANGNSDYDAMRKAIAEARVPKGKPTMILLKTTIGFGAKKENTAGVHGSPLGDEDIRNVKTKFGRDPELKFNVTAEEYAYFRNGAARGQAAHAAWKKRFEEYSAKYPAEAALYTSYWSGVVPESVKALLPRNEKSIATRKASENALAALIPALPQLIGGSADLTGSNLTRPGTAALVDFQKATQHGTYLRFGVREHAMCAIMNGIDAHGGLIAFGGTFLNFVGYALGAVRLSAMSEHGVVIVATHDGIGLGEDGPTHQPVELVVSLRATPNMLVFRPSDQTETSAAWWIAVQRRKSPSVLCLTRQNTVPQPNSSFEGVAKGAYTIVEAENPQVVLVGTGSEVELATKAATLIGSDLRVRVVSMPCTNLFDEQSEEYKAALFPAGVPILSVEAYSSVGWDRYSHYHVGLDTFGASAPAEALYAHFGITAENVADKARKLVAHFGGNAPVKGRKLNLGAHL